MGVRNLLAINQYENFINYLLSKNWQIQKPKGEYEVIRATREKRTLIVFKKLDASVHFSVMDKDTDIIHGFINEKRRNNNGN